MLKDILLFVFCFLWTLDLLNIFELLIILIIPMPFPTVTLFQVLYFLKERVHWYQLLLAPVHSYWWVYKFTDLIHNSVLCPPWYCAHMLYILCSLNETSLTITLVHLRSFLQSSLLSQQGYYISSQIRYSQYITKICLKTSVLILH